MKGKQINTESVKRILVRAPNWIGDAVLSIPALTELRKFFKKTEITLLAPEPIIALLSENHIADHFMALNGKDRHKGIRGKWRLIQELRQESLDLAILLQNAFEAALMCYFSAIPIRYGYDTDGRTFLLTHPVSLHSKWVKKHQMDYYLDLLKPLINLPFETKKPDLKITPEERIRTTNRLEKEGITSNEVIIGIHAGAAYGKGKQWLSDRFARLSDLLVQEFGVKIIFFGSSNELFLLSQIENRMTQKSLNLAGKTNLRELISLISQCTVFVTNDSGPMHIAAALNVPVISIFGSTDWKTTSPVGKNSVLIRKEVECSPCLLRECPIDHRCMTSITVEEVFRVICHQLSLLNKMSVPVVFLDRDGTINEDAHYVSTVEQFRIFPETSPAISLFNQMQLPVFVVSNQSGIERGYFTEELLRTLQVKLEEYLKGSDARIDGFYYCPHRPETHCRCRKPQTGLIDKILEKNPIHLRKSYFVGDQMVDLELAKQIGARGVLVLTGKGKETLQQLEMSNEIRPAYVADHILDAAKWIVEDVKRMRKVIECPTG